MQERAGWARERGRGAEIGAGRAAVTPLTRAGDRDGEIGRSCRRRRQRSDGEGGESERHGKRGFLTGGDEGDAHLMPICRGNCSATEFTVFPVALRDKNISRFKK